MPISRPDFYTGSIYWRLSHEAPVGVKCRSSMVLGQTSLSTLQLETPAHIVLCGSTSLRPELLPVVKPSVDTWKPASRGRVKTGQWASVSRPVGEDVIYFPTDLLAGSL